MNQNPQVATAYAGAIPINPALDAGSSAVSWPAILAGALAAAALSLVLLVLGSGLGFSAISPWSQDGASATAVGTGTVVWVILMAATASAVGGYLAGRLRTRWAGVHTDEVFFRDTAHGFLTWAIATLLSAAVLSSAIGSLVGGAAKLGGTAATAAAAGALSETTTDAASSDGYFVDMMFRSAQPSTDLDDAAARREVTRIVAVAMRDQSLKPADRSYLGQIVARRTGATQIEAERRVTETVAEMQMAADRLEAQARAAADTARKAAAKLALFLVVSLLVGAFCGSYAATLGGRQRDR